MPACATCWRRWWRARSSSTRSRWRKASPPSRPCSFCWIATCSAAISALFRVKAACCRGPREQVIQRMQAAQQRLLKDVWEHRNPELPLKTPEQLVILASIIEKETGKPEERTRVAAVFVNRLKQKMKLQSDPTIIYGLVFGKGRLDHPITKSEKEQPTPYNTYVIDGLPPGPITNPGRASLEAAANPARTKELYFVADGTGGHTFSDSYDQHQRNVGKLRAIEQEAKEPSSDEALAPARAAAPGKPGAPVPKRQPRP